jgi:hypothetical protein
MKDWVIFSAFAKLLRDFDGGLWGLIGTQRGQRCVQQGGEEGEGVFHVRVIS